MQTEGARPGILEFTAMTVLCAAAMAGLYTGLDAAYVARAARGDAFFAPRLPLDEVVPYVPATAWIYFLYYPFLFSVAALTTRSRRVMYEGVVVYVGLAVVSFAVFALLPSRMDLEPRLAACTTLGCEALRRVDAIDHRFNVFPSLHCAYTTSIWLLFRRYSRRVAWLLMLPCLGILVSTVLCKRHFLLDVPAGMALGAAAYLGATRVGCWMRRRWAWATWPPVAALLLFSPRTADAGDGDEHRLLGAAITTPAGAFLRYDYLHRVRTGPVRVGLFSSYFVFSNELGSQISVTANPAWIDARLELAAEPGFFSRVPTGSGAGVAPGYRGVAGEAEAGLGGDAEAAARTFGWRTIARGQVNVNLRGADLWLYSRTTGQARLRNFVEHDRFRGLVLRRELGVEQATALLVRGWGRADGGAGGGQPVAWLYGEYTAGWLAGYGAALPNRVSAGVITERFLARGLVLDLDLFYSFAPAPSDGPGIILAFWYRL